MVENLADFLRATLELDPLTDISIAQEVALQRMYLSIEEQRFPDRLIKLFEIPPELSEARVPALITQPLIENALTDAAGPTGPRPSFFRSSTPYMKRRSGDRAKNPASMSGSS